MKLEEFIARVLTIVLLLVLFLCMTVVIGAVVHSPFVEKHIQTQSPAKTQTETECN